MVAVVVAVVVVVVVVVVVEDTEFSVKLNGYNCIRRNMTSEMGHRPLPK